MKNYKSVSLNCFGLGVLDNLIISNLGVIKDYIKIKLPIIDVSNVLLTRPRYTDVCSKNIFSDLCDGDSWLLCCHICCEIELYSIHVTAHDNILSSC